MSVAEIRRETFYKLTNSADVPDVPSGNRNLLLYTKNPSIAPHDFYSIYACNITDDSLNDSRIYKTGAAWGRLNPNIEKHLTDRNLVKVGDTVTYSVAMRTDSANTIRTRCFLRSHGSSGTVELGCAVISGEWKRYSVTFTLTAKMLAEETAATWIGFEPETATENEKNVYSAAHKIEISETATPYSAAPEDLGWSTATLVPTQSQRYLWKFEYVYYSDGSVEITKPINLTKQNAQRVSRDTIHNIRIAIRDSTDSHNVAFFDNVSGIRYQSANLQRFLAGLASILTIEYNSKDIDTIRTGCKLAFIYKERAYWLNIMDLSKKGYKVEITAYSLGLELNQEERGAHKPANAMSFAEYLAYYDPEHALELGVNEVADKRIKLEWTGTDTILARLFSIANSFDAELEFTVELNQDYSLKRQVLNVYKKGNLGSNRAASPVRVGRELKVINYSDNLKELRTAVRATGKDGLTIDGLNKKVYDDDGNLLYYSNANTVYAPQSRDKYPSVGKKSNDNWIIKELGETEYSTKEALWGYMLGELKKICVPQITYDIEGAVDGDVGDTRTLIDDVHYDPPLYVQGRISELTEDLITGKVTKTTLTNYERKYSQVASELLKQVEQLANDALPYIIHLDTDNGFTFKNNDGHSTVNARAEKSGKTIEVGWRWTAGNEVISNQNSVTISASDVKDKVVVTVSAIVKDKTVASESITFINLSEQPEVFIRTSNGNTFKNGAINTKLTATVWRGGKEIDQDGSMYTYIWTKTDDDGEPDILWNQTHSYSQKTIEITQQDVFRRAQFSCEIELLN